jgi:integrase
MGIFKRDGNYWIDFYYLGKRYRKKIGSNKKQAEVIYGKIKSQIVEGKYLDIKRNQKIKFNEITNIFLDNYSKVNNKSSTYYRNISIIKHLRDFFGDIYLYEIKDIHIENYKKQRIQQEINPSTINRELAVLRAIFNKAKQWEIIFNTPKIRLFKIDNSRLRYLTDKEYSDLLNISCEPLRSIIVIGVNTGMRRGEILNLKWQDIDFKQNLIVLWDTKNKEKRYVPMNKIVRDTLINTNRSRNSDYVFPGKDGINHISEHYISHLFEKIIKKVGIKDFRFHDLRHTFASWLVMAGIDLKTVQELLGHKTFTMTLRYAHLSPEHQKMAVEILEEKNKTIGVQKEMNGHYLDTKAKLQKSKNLGFLINSMNAPG